MHAIGRTFQHIQRLKRRTDLHLARKVWHCTTVLAMCIVYAALTYSEAMIAISILWVVFVPADFLRQRNERLNEWVLGHFGLLFRQHEANGLAGTSYLITGTWILVAVFPKDIVILTLLFLALADPFASFVGIRFGKIKILGAKSLEGTLASFAICTLIAVIYDLRTGFFGGGHVMAIALAGAAGAVSELLPIFGLDDNLTFPLLAAVLLFLLEKGLAAGVI